MTAMKKRNDLTGTCRMQCYSCMEMRDVTLERWEYEMGDYGSVLSTSPVFKVEPPCPGLKRDWADEEPTPEACPFHEYYGDISQAHETVIAVLRDRATVREA